MPEIDYWSIVLKKRLFERTRLFSRMILGRRVTLLRLHVFFLFICLQRIRLYVALFFSLDLRSKDSIVLLSSAPHYLLYPSIKGLGDFNP